MNKIIVLSLLSIVLITPQFAQADWRNYVNQHPELAMQYQREVPGSNKQWHEDLRYLKNHPDVSEALINHGGYLETHPKVSRAIYKNKGWLNNNPGVSKALYNNKALLNNNPELSKDAYAHRKWLATRPDGQLQAAKKAAQKHSVATKSLANDRLATGNRSNQLFKDASSHPHMTKNIYRKAENNRNKTKQLHKKAKNNPYKVKKTYKNKTH
jgi:hypothetical protein